MDSFVINILKEWDLEILLKSFKDHAVDEDNFFYINSSSLQELIPQWGLRCKFENKYRVYKELERNLNKEPVPLEDVTVDLRKSFSSISFEIPTNSPESSPPKSSENNNDLTESNSVSWTYLKSLSLKSYLEFNIRGRKILSTFAKYETVDRSFLSDVIVERELESNFNYKIKRERFLELAQSVCELFPNQDIDLYYIPGVRDSNARGCLYNKYNEWRRDLTYANLINSKSSDTPIDTSKNKSTDDIEWLRNNLEPDDKIQEKWEKTLDYRKKWKKNSIEEYFNSFPYLKRPRGYKLLLLDFDNTYKLNSTLFVSKWSSISTKIILLAEKKKKNPDVKKCLNKYKKLKNTEKNSLLALLLLPFLMPAPGIKTKSDEERDTLDKEFIQECFLLYAQTNAEAREFLAEKSSYFTKHELTNQPYVIIYESPEGLKSCVHVDDFVYNLDSPELAVDCCLKICYILDAKFTQTCEHVWTFLAYHILEMPLAKKIASVLSLITDLKIIK